MGYFLQIRPGVMGQMCRMASPIFTPIQRNELNLITSILNENRWGHFACFYRMRPHTNTYQLIYNPELAA